MLSVFAYRRSSTLNLISNPNRKSPLKPLALTLASLNPKTLALTLINPSVDPNPDSIHVVDDVENVRRGMTDNICLFKMWFCFDVGGFLLIVLFNDIMFGEEMELLRFYYGGKISWGLCLDFGFWDFLHSGFREAVWEESNIGDAIRVQDQADFGRKHRLHRFVLNVFQIAVSWMEYVLVVGTSLTDLLQDTLWNEGGRVETFSGSSGGALKVTGVSTATPFYTQSRHLIPGLIGAGFPILIFWVSAHTTFLAIRSHYCSKHSLFFFPFTYHQYQGLVIFEIVFLYYCVILVPRTTGKENMRSVYGDVIAGMTKGRCVFRGCGLSRLWLWTRGYVKATYDKRGSVVDASEVSCFHEFWVLFLLFLYV
jgi:hypothetical protein